MQVRCFRPLSSSQRESVGFGRADWECGPARDRETHTHTRTHIHKRTLWVSTHTDTRARPLLLQSLSTPLRGDMGRLYLLQC